MLLARVAPCPLGETLNRGLVCTCMHLCSCMDLNELTKQKSRNPETEDSASMHECPETECSYLRVGKFQNHSLSLYVLVFLCPTFRSFFPNHMLWNPCSHYCNLHLYIFVCLNSILRFKGYRYIHYSLFQRKSKGL